MGRAKQGLKRSQPIEACAISLVSDPAPAHVCEHTLPRGSLDRLGDLGKDLGPLAGHPRLSLDAG